VKNIAEIKLANLLHNLYCMSVHSTVIFSINLRDDLEEEVFSIKKGNISITYVEIGLNLFMEELTRDPLRYTVLNKKALYIFRNATYFDINYILSHIGINGINLGRGSSQMAHVVSPLELRFISYLMAMFNFNYSYIYELNTFNTLPKGRYLPFYRPEIN
jgi:hypothetical protein